MAKRINPYSLPIAERQRLLSNEAAELERAECALVLSHKRDRARIRRYIAKRKANCFALHDSIYGAPDPAIQAMSVDELYRELVA